MVASDELTRQIEQQAQPGVQVTRDVPFTGNARFVSYSGLYGDAWDRYANPDSISFESYNQLRLHSMVRAGLILIKAPILSCINRATVECDDPRIKQVVQTIFLDSGLLYRLCRTSLRALEFGLAAHEKLWEVDDQYITYNVKDEETGETYEDVAWSGPLLYMKDLKEVNPLTLRFIMRDPKTKEFAGFVQSWAPTWMYSGTQMEPKQPPTPPKGWDPAAVDGIPVLAQKAFVYTHDMEFGNLWGMPRTRPSYPSWYWVQVALKYYIAWVERKLVPTRIVRHPVGRDVDGTDYSDVAISIGSAIDDVQTVAIPNTRVREAGSSPGGDYLWDFQEVATTDKSETFQNVIAMLNTDILRAMFVPERTFTSGQGFGLFSTDAQAHTDTFLMTEDAEAGDFVDAVNKDAVLPFVVANFGSNAPQATIHVPGITDAHREMLREIVMQILTTPGTPDLIDIKRVLEELDVPVKDIEEAGPAAATAAQPGQQAPNAAAPPQPAGGAMTPAGEPAVGAASTPTAGATPTNLVLNDSIYLDFDSTRWDVSPDPQALSGYRVVDKTTGKRLTGYASEQVIQGYLKASKSAATKSAAASKSAANKAATAAKSAANKAATAAKSQAKHEAAQEAAAQRKQASAAAKAQRQAEAAARKAATQARVAAAKAERTKSAAAKKAAHDALVAQHKADLAAKQAAREAVRQEKAAQRAEAQQAKQEQRTETQQQRTAIAATHAQAATVKAERTAMEKTTKTQSSADAVHTLKENGFNALATTASMNDAVNKATTAAKGDPKSIYTVIQTKDGYIVASKPTSAVDVQATPSNVGLEDIALSDGHAAGRVDTGLLDDAAKRISKLLRKSA